MDKHPEYLPSAQEVIDYIKNSMIQEFLEESLEDLLNCESEDQEIAIDDLSEHIMRISQIETLNNAMSCLTETGYEMMDAVFLVVEAFRFNKHTQSQLKTMLRQIPPYGWDTQRRLK